MESPAVASHPLRDRNRPFVGCTAQAPDGSGEPPLPAYENSQCEQRVTKMSP